MLQKRIQPPLYGQEFFWLRMGDIDDYHMFDTIDDVVNYIQLPGSPSKIIKGDAGIEIYPWYVGNNYISLYLGDSEGTHLADLTESEFREIRDTLYLEFPYEEKSW